MVPTRCSAAASGGVVVYDRWCMGYGGVWWSDFTAQIQRGQSVID